jgi:hypothetical protein
MKNKLYYAIITSIVLLALALFHMPYAYYILLKIIVCGISAYTAYILFEKEKHSLMFWAFCLIAFLYNPIFRIHLSKDFWAIINIVTIVALIVILKEKPKLFISSKEDSKE